MSARKAAARCSAFRRRDSGVGGKLVGLRSLNAAFGATGEPGAGPFKVGSGGERTAEEETIAIRCLDGGGTLSIVGMLQGESELEGNWPTLSEGSYLGPAADVLGVLDCWHTVLCLTHVCTAWMLSSVPSEIQDSHNLHKTRSESNLRT